SWSNTASPSTASRSSGSAKTGPRERPARCGRRNATSPSWCTAPRTDPRRRPRHAKRAGAQGAGPGAALVHHVEEAAHLLRDLEAPSLQLLLCLRREGAGDPELEARIETGRPIGGLELLAEPVGVGRPHAVVEREGNHGSPGLGL